MRNALVEKHHRVEMTQPPRQGLGRAATSHPRGGAKPRHQEQSLLPAAMLSTKESKTPRAQQKREQPPRLKAEKLEVHHVSPDVFVRHPHFARSKRMYEVPPPMRQLTPA